MVLNVGCQSAATDRPRPLDPSIVTLEPQETASFLAARVEGDEEAAEEVASPLYAAKWARRGLSAAQRRALHPEGLLGIHFAFVGGVLDAAGFGHYLYLTTPTAQPDPHQDLHPGSWSVWRVDTDPAGRVVWMELVWLFSPDVALTATIGGMAQLAGAVPATLQPLRPEVLIRIQATSTPESYNLIHIGKANLLSDQAPDGGVVAFYGTDEDGRLRPGVWSYGQPSRSLQVYGESQPTAVPPEEAGVAALDLAYRAALLPGP
jgi:hypothetical protein